MRSTERIRAACLYVTTKLGDLTDDWIIVGGLVPSLLVNQRHLPDNVDAHTGTLDLDLGLGVSLLEDGRYHSLAERLRRAGFEPDHNMARRATSQRWALKEDPQVTMDFLIAPVGGGSSAGRLHHLEEGFSAIVTPGLHLAFMERQNVRLSGMTQRGERAERDVPVCGPGAFVILKALAFRARGENKDAYDLFYVIRNVEGGPGEVARRIRQGRGDMHAKRAIRILSEDFLEPDGLGPVRVARFLLGRQDPAIQADVAGFVRRMLESL